MSAERDLRVAGSKWEVSTARLSGFCAWLPGHATLVHKVILDPPKDQAGPAAAQQLVSLALQLCAHQIQAAAAAAGTGQPAPQHVSGTGLVRPLQQLQLKSLDSRMMLPPDALMSLAAGSCFTELLLRGLPKGQPSAEACCSLATLTSLRRLRIDCDSKTRRPAGWSSVLSELTYLHLHVPLQAADFQLLPAQLLILRLQVDNHSAPTELTLLHMTGLLDLALRGYGPEEVRACLPTSLTKLSAVGPLDIVPELPTLHELTVVLRHMQRLGLLRHLQSLSALRDLQVTLLGLGRDAGGEQLLAVMTEVSKASQVTCLRLHRGNYSSLVTPAAGDNVIFSHNGLTDLTQLCELVVTGFKLQSSDVLKLTCFVWFDPVSCTECSYLGDTAAASLACKLTGLLHLRLCGCGLESSVLLPALAGCTQLRELDLEGNSIPLCDDTLTLLTSLRQLTRLVLTAEDADVSEVTAAGLQQFNAAMPAGLESDIDTV